MNVKIIKDWGPLLAVFKPQGWLTIPGRGNKENIPILSHELGRQLRGIKEKEKEPDLFTIHRLDEGTSGAVLFARTSEVHKELSQMFESGKIKKTYLAIVEGNPDSQIIDAAIFKIPSKKNKSVVDRKGKPSQTIIKNLKFSNGISLIECVPLTGRSHQIRVHLAHVGCPILGDKLYGGTQTFNGLNLDYPSLHALKLELEWPDKDMKVVHAEPEGSFNLIINQF